MKNFLVSFLAAIGVSATLSAEFEVKKDLAQYGGSDYANVVHVARGITLDEAYAIAEASEEIDYFVYLKGGQMILPLPEDKPFDRKDDPFGLVTHTRFRWDAGGYGKGYCRIFEHGDTIFFKKEGMWLGSAPGLADTYVKADRS